MKRLPLFRKLLFFLLSEYSTDAFRVTLTVVLPVVLLFYLQFPQAAITVGLGSLMISLTDASGSVAEKKKVSLISIPAFFLLAFVTALAWPYPAIAGLLIGLVVFVCSMLVAYGSRFSALGTAAILFMIFVWGFRPQDAFIFSISILFGTLWYYLVSLLQAVMFPLRPARHSIGECLMATADFLHSRTALYDTRVPLDEVYNKVLSLHVLVSEKQEQVRQLILRDRKAMREDNQEGRTLLRTAVYTIDLYEEISAVHYDYQHVREKFKVSGVLELVRQMIENLSEELRSLGYALTSGAGLPVQRLHDEESGLLHERLQYIIDRESSSNAAFLRKLQRNITEINDRILAVRREIMRDHNLFSIEDEAEVEYEHFVSSPETGISVFLNNLNFKSPVFRFSIRVTAATVFAYLLTVFFALGAYSYWILLTVIIVMRPSFNHTQKRNRQRLGGSLLGIAMGLGLLYALSSPEVMLILAVLLLLLFFALNRINYLLSVVAITAMVVLCLSIYTGSGAGFIFERLYDTLLGCGISFVFAYVLPTWEARRLSFFMTEVLGANIRYWELLREEISGRPRNTTAYKLLRKETYISLANLSAAFKAMLAEPNQLTAKEQSVFYFQVLNQIMISAASSIFSSLQVKELAEEIDEHEKVIEQVIGLLKKGAAFLEDNDIILKDELHVTGDEEPPEAGNWLVRVSYEILNHSVAIAREQSKGTASPLFGFRK